jgi:hypothetical protein
VDKKVFSDTCNLKIISAAYSDADGNINETKLDALFDDGSDDKTIALVNSVCDQKCFGHLSKGMNALMDFMQVLLLHCTNSRNTS